MATFYYYLFLALGVAVSFEDWSQKRIRNHWIVLGMLACAAGFCYLLWNSLLGYCHKRFWVFGEYYLPWHYYPHVLIHLFLSLTAAVTLWRLAIWPAGDAKLFILFAFFLVLINPNLPGFPLLLFMLLLVNIFVPAGLVCAAETVLRAVRKLPVLLEVDWTKWIKAKAEMIRIRCKEAWPYRYNYLTLAANIFALFYLMQVAQARFHRLALGPFGQVVVFLLLFVVWGRLACVLREKAVSLAAFTILSVGTISGVLFWHWDFLGCVVSALKMTVNFGVFLSLVRVVFYWAIERESLRELRADQLMPGTVLSDETWDKLGAEKDLAGKLGERYSDGLGADAVETLKAWLETRKAAGSGGENVPLVRGYTVYQTIPFALWIFLGALLTLSRRVNVVTLLVPHLERAQVLCKATAARWLS